MNKCIQISFNVEDIDELQLLVPEIDIPKELQRLTIMGSDLKGPLSLLMSGVADKKYSRMAVVDNYAVFLTTSAYGDPIPFGASAKITILKWLKENKKEDQRDNS
jgi:hypothetical protein